MSLAGLVTKGLTPMGALPSHSTIFRLSSHSADRSRDRRTRRSSGGSQPSEAPVRSDSVLLSVS